MGDPYSCIQSGQEYAIKAKYSCLVRCKCKSSCLPTGFSTSDYFKYYSSNKIDNYKTLQIAFKCLFILTGRTLHSACLHSTLRRSWAADWLALTSNSSQGRDGDCLGEAQAGPAAAATALPCPLFWDMRAATGENREWSNSRCRLFSKSISPLLFPLKKLSEELSQCKLICRDVFQCLCEILLLTALLVAEIVFSF